MFVYAVAFAHAVVFALHVLLPVFTYFLVLTHAVASVIFAFTTLLVAQLLFGFVTLILGATVSNLYIHVQYPVFHALSSAHKLKYHVH